MEKDRTLSDNRRTMMGQPLCPTPLNPLRDFHSYTPSYDAILHACIEGMTGMHRPKSQPVHHLNLELVVSPEAALRGGSVAMEIPISHRCARCHGSGRTGFHECDACDGHGLLWQTRRIDVLLPKRIDGQTTVPISLHHLGVRHLHLNLHVRISEKAGLQHH